MLNPSTADEMRDDPTVRRCVEWAVRWGHSTMEVVNLFALRSPHPKDLLGVMDPIGPDNTLTIAEKARGSRTVIAAWGNGPSGKRAQSMMRLRLMTVRACLRGIEVLHLGLTSAGWPKHPLARGKHRIPDNIRPNRYLWK